MPNLNCSHCCLFESWVVISYFSNHLNARFPKIRVVTDENGVLINFIWHDATSCRQAKRKAHLIVLAADSHFGKENLSSQKSVSPKQTDDLIHSLMASVEEEIAEEMGGVY